MDQKLYITENQLESLRELRPSSMTEEEWSKWVGDCVEVIKPFW